MGIAVGIRHRQLDDVALRRIRSTTVCFRIGRVGSITSAFRTFRQRISQTAVFIDPHRSLARRRFSTHQRHIAASSEQHIGRHRHHLAERASIRMSGNKVRLVHGYLANAQFRRAGLIDAHGHLGRMRIAVGIRRHQRKAVRRSFRCIGIRRIGVGIVIIDDHRAVGQMVHTILISRHALDGHRTGCGCAVGSERHIKTLRRALAFRQTDAFRRVDRRHVVGDLDTDHSRAAVAVAVRHHNFHFVGDGIVFAAPLLAVFLGGLVQRIGIGQIRAVKARHVQVPLIRLDRIARQGAVLPDDDAADGDGRHAVRGGDAHAAGGRRGAPAAAAIQGGFVHLEHIVRHGRRKIFSLDGDVRIIRVRAGSGRRHGHAVVVLIISARLHRICGQLHAAVEADVQTPQMVEAVQQVAAAVFVVAAAARGAAAGSGAGGGHQVFTKGREEILAADLHTFHLERRHLFLGIRGVEILQLDGSAILERQDEVVAAAGQRRGIRRKVKDEAPVRSAGDGLRGTSSRLGKTDIGHEGPPEKKWYLSKNR